MKRIFEIAINRRERLLATHCRSLTTNSIVGVELAIWRQVVTERLIINPPVLGSADSHENRIYKKYRRVLIWIPQIQIIVDAVDGKRL